MRISSDRSPLARRSFHLLRCTVLALAGWLVTATDATAKPVAAPGSSLSITEVAPGVHRLRIGQPEEFVPSDFRVAPIQTEKLAALPEPTKPHPFNLEAVSYRQTSRGLLIHVKMDETEDWYGGGLLLSHLRQTGRRQVMKVASDPPGRDGSGHAPTPFFLNTAGHGFLVDTAREVELAFGGHQRKGQGMLSGNPELAISEAALYDDGNEVSQELSIMVPRASGVDLFLFSGPTMRHVAQRHVLFSGGGFDVPEWSLGVWYRSFTRADANRVRELADYLEADRIPVSVYGLEPGWQSKAYSSSFVWDPERFPDPQATVDDLRSRGYHVNLWQQAFTHPSSPLYPKLLDKSGDHLVWNGLVPDFALPEARKIFADHMRGLVDQGITGFKLDECDGSDNKSRAWSWPDHAQFPSGADGEQMHGVYGLLYMKTLQEALTEPTFGQVRHAGLFSSPLPYALYSDLYDHKSFLRGVGSAGMSGLIWTPEVRHGTSADDLVQRMAAMVLAPQFLINAWYCTMPPWHQWDKPLNQAGIPLPDDKRIALTDRVRAVAELRVKFVPALKDAFANYARTGIAPFRAPVLDHPEVKELRNVDDAWMVGENLYFAPIPGGTTEREIILPPGEWRDYYTGETIAGGSVVTRSLVLEEPPIFVRAGADI